ncbi:hypothetical protein [Bradyrhizobium sp. USDA 4452]
MRRLDEDQTLEALLHARKVSLAHIQQLADKLQQFYSRAARALINVDSYRLSLKRAVASDRRMLINPAFRLNRGTIEWISRVQHRYLHQHREVLTDRIRRRFILDAHGDLRPEHIWLSPPFPIIDCLEFNSRLRTLDALDELAFLHLECDRLGGLWVGNALRSRLAILLDDDPATGLFLFYRINRAMLRARLSIAHMIDPHPRTPEKWPRMAHTYLSIARMDARQLDRLLSVHA